jgi:hypothetical protein
MIIKMAHQIFFHQKSLNLKVELEKVKINSKDFGLPHFLQELLQFIKMIEKYLKILKYFFKLKLISEL